MISKLNIYILTIVFSILTANFSLAAQTLDKDACTERDVSAKLGPIRNQGNIGWCYANVAADLLTFRFSKELQGRPASAGFVAIMFNEHLRGRANADAGYVSPSLILSQWNGICPQELQENVLKDSPYKTIREQIDSLVKLKSDYDAWRTRQVGAFSSPVLQTYRESQSALNSLSDADLIGILNSSTSGNFPRRLAERMCKDHMIKAKLHGRIMVSVSVIEWGRTYLPSVFKNDIFTPHNLQRKGELIEKIHAELEKYNMVGIGYNTRIFYDLSIPNGPQGGAHASSIVGRKWNEKTRTCEFKLRNTWANDCSQYTNPDLKHKCDEKSGYIYIPDTLLEETISDIVYYHI